jgi:uncharacterized membrane protein YfcA
MAKWIVVLFGLFFIGTGLLMLVRPKKAREILKKAGSTNFINYAEITIRLIPAMAMVYYSDFTKYPPAFKIFGWFMIATSVILYFVPRRLHHDFSVKCAAFLKPQYFQLVSPFSFFIGVALVYSVF